MLIFQIFTVLFPIFAIVAIGYIYMRFRSLDIKVINRLNMDLLSPCLLFSVLSSDSFNIVDYQQLTLAAILMVLSVGLLGTLIARLLKIQVKSFVPSMMFVNAGNMGIPVAVFAFGEAGLAAAMLFLMIIAIMNFTLGIYIMDQQASWFGLLKLPLIQVAIIGGIISIMQIEVPSLLRIPIKMVGECAIPVMLISLGARLTKINFTYWKIGIIGALFRPILGMSVFLIIYPWFDLTPLQTGGLIIFAALPPAVVNYIIAEEYQQEPDKVAAIVMLGNLMSFVSLPIALMFALPSL